MENENKASNAQDGKITNANDCPGWVHDKCNCNYLKDCKLNQPDTVHLKIGDTSFTKLHDGFVQVITNNGCVELVPEEMEALNKFTNPSNHLFTHTPITYTESEVEVICAAMYSRLQMIEFGGMVLRKANNWIDKKEKSPDHRQEVNVLLEDGRVKISTFRVNNGFKSFYCGDSDTMSYATVTHWKELKKDINICLTPLLDKVKNKTT